MGPKCGSEYDDGTKPCAGPDYLRSDCLAECINTRIEEKCGCGLGFSPSVSRQCDLDDETCVNPIFDPADGQLRHKDGRICMEVCGMPCDEVAYEMQLSTADYPAKFESKVVRKAYSACYAEMSELLEEDFGSQCAQSGKVKTQSGKRLLAGNVILERKSEKKIVEIFNSDETIRQLSANVSANTTTRQGCKCKEVWTASGLGTCSNYCCNLDNDANGDWCLVEDEVCQGDNWGYCGEALEYEYEALIDLPASPSDNDINNFNGTTLGCACQQEWRFFGMSCLNYCCDPDNTGYDWCIVEDENCQGTNWGQCGTKEEECAPGCPVSWINDFLRSSM